MAAELDSIANELLGGVTSVGGMGPAEKSTAKVEQVSALLKQAASALSVPILTDEIKKAVQNEVMNAIGVLKTLVIKETTQFDIQSPQGKYNDIIQKTIGRLQALQKNVDGDTNGNKQSGPPFELYEIIIGRTNSIHQVK